MAHGEWSPSQLWEKAAMMAPVWFQLWVGAPSPILCLTQEHPTGADLPLHAGIGDVSQSHSWCVIPLSLHPSLKTDAAFCSKKPCRPSSPGWGREQVLGDLELGSWVRWAVPPGPAYQSNTNWEFSGKNQIALKMLKLMKSYWGICFYVNIHSFSRVTNCSAPKYISFTYINIYIYMSHVYMYTSMYQTLGLLKSFTPTVGHWEDSLL